MMMYGYEEDPDVIRWGLHHLMEVCSVSNGGSPAVFTRYDKDLSSVECVSECYCVSNGDESTNVENDEMIARALQEEFSRVAVEEKDGSSSSCECDCHRKESVLAQDWATCSKRHEIKCNHEQDLSDDDDDQSCCPEMADESSLDGEVGKRINQMVPIRHVPKINGELPSADEATSDYQRLMDRLQLYDLVELKVSGDGNCQFRSLSDQIYRSTDHHKLVREQVVHQGRKVATNGMEFLTEKDRRVLQRLRHARLKTHSELYAAYVPMAYDEYLKKISTDGEWGDHVTLQAAADVFGVKIFVLTSFKDTCYIEILPCTQKSKRIIFLSFWAEVHYNSIYPEGELPTMDTKKKKRWWMLGS